MHTIEDIYAIIHDAEQLEVKGEYLQAYRTYRDAIDAIDNDDDSFPFAGINPAPYDDAQSLANKRCKKLWNCLTEDEKKVILNPSDRPH